MIPMQMLPSGRQRLRIWLRDSSRTLRNTKETQQEKLLFPLVLRCEQSPLTKRKDSKRRYFKTGAGSRRFSSFCFLHSSIPSRESCSSFKDFTFLSVILSPSRIWLHSSGESGSYSLLFSAAAPAPALA